MYCLRKRKRTNITILIRWRTENIHIYFRSMNVLLFISAAYPACTEETKRIEKSSQKIRCFILGLTCTFRCVPLNLIKRKVIGAHGNVKHWPSF